MNILNTTFVIERPIFDDFVHWLKEVYVKAAVSTEIFDNPRIAQIISNEDPSVVSIACELSCESLSEAARWHDTTALLLRDDMTSRWGNKALFFTTYLKVIDND